MTVLEKYFSHAVQQTFTASTLKLMFIIIKHAMRRSNMDHPPTHFIFNTAYQYTSICNSRCGRRTERIMATRISEHVPKHLSLSGPRLPQSCIAKYILDTGQIADETDRFTITCYQKNQTVLRFAEPSSIRCPKPKLCKQLDRMFSLSFSW